MKETYVVLIKNVQSKEVISCHVFDSRDCCPNSAFECAQAFLEGYNDSVKLLKSGFIAVLMEAD